MLAHNRLAELSVADADLLQPALTQLGSADCMLATGYAPAAIADLLRRVKTPAPSCRHRFREAAMVGFRGKLWRRGIASDGGAKKSREWASATKQPTGNPMFTKHIERAEAWAMAAERIEAEIEKLPNDGTQVSAGEGAPAAERASE